MTRAKRYAHGIVDTDMQAGPSEICIVADATASAPLVAADPLSQAEHDELAAAVLITTLRALPAVQRELQVQLKLSSAAIAKQSLARFGNIFLVETIAAALISQCCGPGTPRTLG